MSLKKEFRIGITVTEVAFGQDCKALIPRGDLNARFLAYAIKARSHQVLCMVDEAGHGTGRLPTDQLGKLSIGFPPLPEQRRIAEILDSLEGSVSAERQAAEKLARVYDAHLVALLAGSNCTTQRWESVDLGSAGMWYSGGTPPTSNPSYWNGDIPWISASSLKEFDILDSDRRITELGACAGSRLVPESTILFVVRGMSLKTEFRVGIAGRRLAFGQDCKAIIASPRFEPRFLAYTLKAKSQEVLAMVDEAGHGTGRLSTGLLQRIRIGVPDKAEQRGIVKVLDHMGNLIHHGRVRCLKLTQLKHGLMQGLLTGQVKVAEAEKFVEAVA